MPRRSDYERYRNINDVTKTKNYREIRDIDAKAKKAGMTYGQYVALQYATLEKQQNQNKATNKTLY